MNIIAELHTHTVASTHAFSTVDELADECARRKIPVLAVTDHAPGMPDSPHIWHFHCLRHLPRVIRGVFVLRGIEVDVVTPRGDIDFDLSRQNPFDFVIASMHGDTTPFELEPEVTSAWLNVCENKQIDCLGHLGQAWYPFDHDAVIKKCSETQTLVEINASSFKIRRGSRELCPQIALKCKQYNTPIIVTTDAHSRWQIGDNSECVKMLEEINFPEELIINADLDRLKSYFNERKGLLIC